MKFRNRYWTLLALSAFPVGCQSSKPANSTTPAPSGNQITDVTPTGTDPNAKTFSPDDILPADASAAHLQDIGGDLLLYFRIYGKMPTTLADLKTIVSPDSAPTLTNAAGQPYAYSSGGLWIPNKDKAIFAYDPTLNPDGKRWCLLMAPPQKSGAAISINVVEIPEPIFLSYRPMGG